jgi:acyl-CoA synthetase (NDP forming)
MTIDFKSIDKIFERAEKDGRAFLFESEVYQMLKGSGFQTPKFKFIKKGQKVQVKDLAGFRTPALVLKIVAPLILHKTDVGGIMFVKNGAAAVNAGI